MDECAIRSTVFGPDLGYVADTEIARWEWRLGESSDPAVTLETFLRSYGLPAHDLYTFPPRDNEPEPSRVTAFSHNARAQLFFSATGCAVLAGLPTGAPSPTPHIPDVVAIIHAGVTDSSNSKPDRGEPLTLGAWQPSWTPSAHSTAIEDVKQAIKRGSVYQANVVGHRQAPYTGDATPALRAVAGLPEATYGGIIAGHDWALATATPELLLEVENGTITTRPIKGTRPATQQGRVELLASSKERAEHIMIVDLMRNDLALVAEIGSVQVKELFKIRRWSGLWQAESVVQAKLKHGTGLSRIIKALCPGGSVTGAPKRAAMALLAQLEPVGRGPSMGALGWLTPKKLTLGLTIRTVAASQGQLHVWAGGGITIDSESAAEVAEAEAKAAPLLKILADDY